VRAGNYNWWQCWIKGVAVHGIPGLFAANIDNSIFMHMAGIWNGTPALRYRQYDR
jgi:hypothetical protein